MALDRTVERERGDDAWGKKSLWQRVKDVALMDVAVLVKGVDEGSIEILEERLLEADFGVAATLHLTEAIETAALKGKIRTADEFRGFIEERLVELFEEGDPDRALARAAEPPTVVLLVGVNGAGKTTAMARLARMLEGAGESVLLAAADTFRAGAIEQVRTWAGRLDVPVVAGQPGGDPAAVVYDAIEAAARRGTGYVLADTAGRLHTQSGLMDELAKVVRVAGDRLEGAPHEVLLVLDATTGQNALVQARTFSTRLPVSGLVVCKLDGTARGGVVVAVRREIGVPVKFVGLGEGPDDLAAFDPAAFAGGLVR